MVFDTLLSLLYMSEIIHEKTRPWPCQVGKTDPQHPDDRIQVLVWGHVANKEQSYN